MGQEKRKPTDLDKMIGARLRSRRKLLGLNQDQVATRCHISPQQYFKYEHGMSRISVAQLIEFASALDAPVSWFVAGIERAQEMPDDLAVLIRNPRAVELLVLFNNIDDEAVEKSVLAFTRGIMTGTRAEVTAARR